MEYGVWLSRFFLALIFLLNGLGVIDQARGAQELAGHGVPMSLVPLLMIGGRILQVVAGVALLLGLAALALAAFLIPATLAAHDFWAYRGPELQAQLVNFSKNVAMLGGLLLVVFRPAHEDRTPASS